MIKTLLRIISIIIFATQILGCSDPKIEPEGGGGGSQEKTHVDYDANKWIYKVLVSEYLWYKNIKPESKQNFNQSYLMFFRSLLTQPPAYPIADESMAHDGRYESGQFYPYSHIAREEIGKRSSRAPSAQYSFGFGYQFLYDQEDNVFGSVLYVAENSPVYGKLTRADRITAIDGQKLTYHNYNDWYPKILPTYFAQTIEITKETMTSNGLVKSNIKITSKIYDDNPVMKSKILDIEGKKIGYLVYNGFENSPNDQANVYTYANDLKNAFQTFKAATINELVLDLRYNPGGYVHLCQMLCSMVTADDFGIFMKFEYNDKKGTLDQKFMRVEDMSRGAYGSAPGVALGLKRVFVLTSGSTASSSELVINGLRGAGINVIQIGTVTHGKNVGGRDYTKAEKAPLAGGSYGGYDYTISLITFKALNRDGKANFANGITPNYIINDGSEDDIPLFVLKELGDQDELLLAQAISLITGVTPAAQMQMQESRSMSQYTSKKMNGMSSIDIKRVRGMIAQPEEK